MDYEVKTMSSNLIKRILNKIKIIKWWKKKLHDKYNCIQVPFDKIIRDNDTKDKIFDFISSNNTIKNLVLSVILKPLLLLKLGSITGNALNCKFKK